MMITIDKLQIDDLIQRYGNDESTRLIYESTKEYPRKDKQQCRISGKRKIKRFCDHFNKLSDYEKLRFVYFRYHPVPKQEYPSEKWSWVLDVKFYTRKVGQWHKKRTLKTESRTF